MRNRVVPIPLNGRILLDLRDYVGGEFGDLRIMIFRSQPHPEDAEYWPFRPRIEAVMRGCVRCRCGRVVDELLQLLRKSSPVFMVRRQDGFQLLAERLELGRVPVERHRNMVPEGILHFGGLGTITLLAGDLCREIRIENLNRRDFWINPMGHDVGIEHRLHFAGDPANVQAAVAIEIGGRLGDEDI